MRDDDLFANFERMRRQLDELFGHTWERVGVASTQTPRVLAEPDVYYCGDPPKAVVTADLQESRSTTWRSRSRAGRTVIGGERTDGGEDTQPPLPADRDRARAPAPRDRARRRRRRRTPPPPPTRTGCCASKLLPLGAEAPEKIALTPVKKTHKSHPINRRRSADRQRAGGTARSTITSGRRAACRWRSAGSERCPTCCRCCRCARRLRSRTR